MRPPRRLALLAIAPFVRHDEEYGESEMKRALLVGIDNYPTVGSLNGCIADATALQGLLERHHDASLNWCIALMTGTSDSDVVSRGSLRAALIELFANPRDTDLLFFFAGHGAQTPWGAELVTQDAIENSLGVSMNDLITLANDSAARSVTIILDCCFSGDAGNTASLQSGAIAESFRIGRALLRENVTIMAASRATEPAKEIAGHGAFTRILLDGLAGGATDHQGYVTALSLYGYISAAFNDWDQRPILKTYLNKPVVLRVGAPWLNAELLRQLPKHFSSEFTHIQLTAAHEGDGRPLPTDTLASIVRSGS